MKLTYIGINFVLLGAENRREIAQKLGFSYDVVLCRWFTPSHKIASSLIEFADELAKIKIKQAQMDERYRARPIEETYQNKFGDDAMQSDSKEGN